MKRDSDDIHFRDLVGWNLFTWLWVYVSCLYEITPRLVTVFKDDTWITDFRTEEFVDPDKVILQKSESLDIVRYTARQKKRLASWEFDFSELRSSSKMVLAELCLIYNLPIQANKRYRTCRRPEFGVNIIWVKPVCSVESMCTPKPPRSHPECFLSPLYFAYR